MTFNEIIQNIWVKLSLKTLTKDKKTLINMIHAKE